LRLSTSLRGRKGCNQSLRPSVPTLPQRRPETYKGWLRSSRGGFLLSGHSSLVSPELLSAIETAISRQTGRTFRIERSGNVSGGCINRSMILEGSGTRFFAKLNERRFDDAFAAEADGLDALAKAGMRAPAVVARGMADDSAFLVLEYLELRQGDDAAFAKLGRALAALHAHHGERFGWRRDNFIGATAQRNRESASWVEFWQRERLAPQLALAADNGFRGRLQQLGEVLLGALPRMLAAYVPAPALLHGDLWGGNAAFLADGTPVLFDPAAYYGDREADLAMTELFGGFPGAFFAAYREAAPLAEGYPLRRTLYNLYHVLNHANLFGGGYATQAERMMEQLLAETRG
jgi:protein-ribulosamine 3-kinase